MINANELRIGNWVSATENFEKFPAPMRVIGIGFASYDCMGNYELDDFGITTNSDGDYNKSWPYEQVHPIPLTHDILVKCGLRLDRIETIEYKQWELTTITKYYTDWDWIEESGGFEIRVTTNSKDDTIAINHKYKSNIQYLHQLQNLYFALTNEELNIQL